MNNSTKDDSIRFFKHQYRTNARSISRKQQLRMHNENIKLWGSSTVPWCGYADDLILCDSHSFIAEWTTTIRATTILDKVFTNYGFCINVSKTEAMVLNHMLLEDEYPDTIISLRNVPLQNWTEFKYLFSCISQSEHSTGDTEINHRIQMEYAKFATMAKTKNQLKFCRKLCRSAERSNHSFLTIW